MPITLQNSEIALRACILYEYFDNQPIETSYKNFCGKVGAGAMSFQEFKFWFERFQSGNHDMDEKLESNNLPQVNPEPFEFPSLSDIPEKISEKAWCIRFINFMNGVIPKPESISICELPPKILKMVFEKLESIDRLKIRKVSRLLRSAISQNYIGFKEIKIEVKNDWICLHLDDFVIYYGNLSDSCSVNFKRCKTIIGNSDYMALTLMDLAALLNCPKIILETLQLNLPIELDTVNRVGFFISLQNILHTVKQISTKKIILEELYGDEAVSFIKCFEAVDLEEIYLQRVSETKYPLKEIVNLEQFKRARCFVARGTSYSIPTEHLFKKLTYFEIQVAVFSKQDAVNIKKMLSNSPNLQSCCFHFSRSGITDLATVFHPGHVGGEYANLIYKTYNNIKFVINICTKCFKITRK